MKSIHQYLGKQNFLSLERKIQKRFKSHTRDISSVPTESVEDPSFLAIRFLYILTSLIHTKKLCLHLPKCSVL